MPTSAKEGLLLRGESEPRSEQSVHHYAGHRAKENDRRKDTAATARAVARGGRQQLGQQEA